MKRIMIAGTGSGSGKTTITCGLLQALADRGYQVSAFKCGPDYIDPMFHSRIIGAKSRNLDSCFCDRNMLNYLLQKNAGEISVIEGVMGFYDGVGEQGSSRQVAVDTETPVVLVIDCKGMSLSIGAMMKGFLEFRKPNQIVGFIFNRLPESQIGLAKKLCTELHTEYLGRFPFAPDCQIESRHLGLVTAMEIADLKHKVEQLAKLCEQHILTDRILALSAQAGQMPFDTPSITGRADHGFPIRIAVARDEAFCFYYEDNLDILRELGCELVEFSPLHDNGLPERIHGLILGGGYPELYAERLSDNDCMRSSVCQAVRSGLPTIAECGGFMYLHQQLEDAGGCRYPMAGLVPGHAVKTPKLQRFGYVDLTAKRDSLLAAQGEKLAAHEFHYWDSTAPGTDYIAEKRSNGLRYDAVIAGDSLYAGFPHLYFYANPKAAVRYVEKCRAYAERI